MPRLLITGGAGFIGANFTHYWLERHPGDRLVVLDALTYAGNRASLAPLEAEPSFRFVEGDIRDRPLVTELLQEESLDTIVHFAAESHVDRSIASPEEFVDVNVAGTASLLEAARSVWLSGESGSSASHRFHQISTDEVFGSLEPDDPAFNERTPYAPNSPYAASKAAADHLVRTYGHTFGLAVTISNCSNNYGPFQFPEKLLPLCIVNLLSGKELPIYGEGKNVRDWLHVTDHCVGIEAVLKHGVSGETYNVGSRCERTNLTIVTKLCRIVDRLMERESSWLESYPDSPPAHGEPCEGQIRFVADRQGHDHRYAIDPGKLETELGWTSSVPLDSGLESAVRWYLENREWWESILSRGSYRDWIRSQYRE